jgi:hypothetical protein
MCGREAWRKVGEVIMHDDPQPSRHPLTAYVCLECFAAVMHGRRAASAATDQESNDQR